MKDDIMQIQTFFAKGIDKKVIFEYILNSILKYTESEYGFIGQIKCENELPFLETCAITNIAWTDELYKKFSIGSGLRFTNLNTLFGICILEKIVIISNDPLNDPRRGGKSPLPKGHPPLNRYIGIPIIVKDEMIGMIGIANAPRDYTMKTVENINPFLLSCNVIITAYTRLEVLEYELKEKAKYLGTISHELKTPMNAILGYSQLLEYETNKETIMEYIKEIRISSDGLMGLLNNLLLLNKNDQVEINKDEFDVYNIINTTIKNLSVFKDRLNIEINNYIPMGVTIDTDKAMFAQILNNIISNGIKYNNLSGYINIYIKIKNDKTFLCIDNTGNIIPSDMKEKIFEPFIRLDNKTNVTGNGLGLSIVKDLCKKLEITIKVENEMRVNSFRIDISKLLKTEIKTGNEDDIYNILYVEDSTINIKLMKIIFKKNFPEIYLNIDTNGNNIINELEKKKYDYILLDYHLPNRTAKDIIEEFENNNINLPISILTADSTIDTLEYFSKKDIDIFYKPINIKSFVEFLNTKILKHINNKLVNNV